MQTKTLNILLTEANKEIKLLSFSESKNLIENSNAVIIDV